jgi:putative intracellular protease/amidase
MEWKTRLEQSRRKRRRRWTRFVALLLVIAVGGFSYWLYSLPPPPEAHTPPAIPQTEMEDLVAALAPTKRTRPVVAIVGLNEGTETTDYLMPYGILRRADVADVMALAMKPGTVELFPVFKLEPQSTVAEFDAKYPDGADYVIVPAMLRDDEPNVLRWLRSQSEKGALVIGVCAGATVVANAGLLDGRRATTHWYYRDDMLESHPSIRYVRDRRFVADRGVLTTTGISASMPMTLTLIEAIAGHDEASAVAAELGLTHWDARHASDAFSFNRRFALTAMRNKLSLWSHEELGVELKPGVDEVSLALVADAWSRTFRSRAVPFAASGGPLTTRGGLRLLPEVVRDKWDPDTALPPLWERPAASALDGALAAIAERYGKRTRVLVAEQLEYSE